MAWRALCVLFLTMVLSFSLSSYARSAPKTVLVIGDSLSAEYGLPYGSGWVSLLKKKIKAEKLRAKIVNASISGDTTSGGKRRLPLLLLQHQPSVVIIELGGNDGLRGLSLRTIEANLRAMISAAHKISANVLLTGMRIPPNYGRHYTESFAAIYTRLANETDSPLVPFLLDGFADQDDLFLSDGVHPTAEAQPLILANVWMHLEPMLE